MSIPSQYQRDCSALCNTTTDDRTDLMQPLSNRDLNYQKYCTLRQLARGGHPQSCSTMHYGHVQKKQWTQLPDTREVEGWSSTPSRDGTCWCQGPTFSMEVQTRLRYHNCQNQGKEYWVLTKVEICGSGQLWKWWSCCRACRPVAPPRPTMWHASSQRQWLIFFIYVNFIINR